ncbi:MAG: hypothetical protein AB7O65_04990, partial [Candidatus Korobacteraceae bacterium]
TGTRPVDRDAEETASRNYASWIAALETNGFRRRIRDVSHLPMHGFGLVEKTIPDSLMGTYWLTRGIERLIHIVLTYEACMFLTPICKDLPDFHRLDFRLLPVQMAFSA